MKRSTLRLLEGAFTDKGLAVAQHNYNLAVKASDSVKGRSRTLNTITDTLRYRSKLGRLKKRAARERVEDDARNVSLRSLKATGAITGATMGGLALGYGAYKLHKRHKAKKQEQNNA